MWLFGVGASANSPRQMIKGVAELNCTNQTKTNARLVLRADLGVIDLVFLGPRAWRTRLLISSTTQKDHKGRPYGPNDAGVKEYLAFMKAYFANADLNNSS